MMRDVRAASRMTTGDHGAVPATPVARHLRRDHGCRSRRALFDHHFRIRLRGELLELSTSHAARFIAAAADNRLSQRESSTDVR